MFIDILLGGAIFIYAIWAIVRHIKRSREGVCASCELKDRCPSTCRYHVKNK